MDLSGGCPIEERAVYRQGRGRTADGYIHAESERTHMLPAHWTPIAMRSRGTFSKHGQLTWCQLADAPIGVNTAYEMAAAGKLIMASRHYDDAVELVVRPSIRFNERVAS